MSYFSPNHHSSSPFFFFFTSQPFLCYTTSCFSITLFVLTLQTYFFLHLYFFLLLKIFFLSFSFLPPNSFLRRDFPFPLIFCFTHHLLFPLIPPFFYPSSSLSTLYLHCSFLFASSIPFPLITCTAFPVIIPPRHT